MESSYVILLSERDDLSSGFSVRNGYRLPCWCVPNWRNLGAVLCSLRCRGLKSVISVHKSEVRSGVTCNAGFIAVNFPPLIKAQRRKDGEYKTCTVPALKQGTHYTLCVALHVLCRKGHCFFVQEIS
jgi:hypothetical protein